MDERTKRMVKRLPSFFKGRFQEDAVTNKFLAPLAEELGLLDQEVGFLRASGRLPTAPTSEVSEVYRGIVPAEAFILPFEVVSASGDILRQVTTLRDFLNMQPDDPFYTPELHVEHPYIIVAEKRVIYTRRDYGSVSFRFFQQGRLIQETKVNLEPWSIWTSLDDHGLYYSTPRRSREDNESYKKRLMDAATLPFGADSTGLSLAIHNFLGLAYETLWVDGALDLLLQTERIVPQSIRVDGEPFPESKIIQTANGLILQGDPTMQGVTRRVRYYAGIDVRSFYDLLQGLDPDALYITGGSQVDRIRALAVQIHEQAPVLWHERRWDEGYWPEESDVLSLGLIPAQCDTF